MGNTISARGRRPEGRRTAGETAGAAASLSLIGARVCSLRENEGSSCRSGLGEKERSKRFYLSVASRVNIMALFALNAIEGGFPDLGD
jgi:hypothetical protein